MKQSVIEAAAKTFLLDTDKCRISAILVQFIRSGLLTCFIA